MNRTPPLRDVMRITRSYNPRNSRHAQTLVELNAFSQEKISIVSPEFVPGIPSRNSCPLLASPPSGVEKHSERFSLRAGFDAGDLVTSFSSERSVFVSKVPHHPPSANDIQSSPRGRILGGTLSGGRLHAVVMPLVREADSIIFRAHVGGLTTD